MSNNDLTTVKIIGVSALIFLLWFGRPIFRFAKRVLARPSLRTKDKINSSVLKDTSTSERIKW